MASDLGRGADPATSESCSPKDEQALKKRLNKLADALKRLAGNTVEAFSAIVESVIGALLSFFCKVAGFVAEHTWNLIVLVAEHIGVWLMPKVKKYAYG